MSLLRSGYGTDVHGEVRLWVSCRSHRGDVVEVLDELGAVFCCWNKYPEIFEYLSCSRYLSVCSQDSASVSITKKPGSLGVWERGERRGVKLTSQPPTFLQMIHPLAVIALAQLLLQ